MTYNEYRIIVAEIVVLRDAVRRLEEKIDHMSTTTATGLAALAQADTDLAAAVATNTSAEAAIVAEIAALQQQLAAVPTGDPDGQVASIAADLETKIAALQQNTAAMQAAVAPPAAPESAPSQNGQEAPTTAAPATEAASS